MRRALKAFTIGAALLTLGLAPVTVSAQDGQGQVGGVTIDASGQNEVRSSDAGESRQTTINNRPGNSSVNEADGQGNREEVRANRRAERQAQREAERAAAAEAAPVAEEAAWEPAPETAWEEPAPVEAAAPAAAPIVALPSTGTGDASQAPAALATILAALAAVGAFVTFRRAREA